MSLICLNKLGWNVDKVAFEKEVRDICSDPLIRIKNPNWLTLVFNAESSMKFPNVNRIGAVGYIQITKSTAKDLQTTVEHLKTLSPLEYLYYVRKYLRMRVKQYGAPDSAYELYALVHYPVAFKKAENYVLYRKGSDAYSGNSALDYNADGAVTVKEMNQFFDKRLPLLYDKELLFTPEDSSRIYLADIELKYILAAIGGYYFLNRKKTEAETLAKTDDAFYLQFADNADTVHTFNINRAVENSLAIGFSGFANPTVAGTFPLIDDSDASKFNAASRQKWTTFIKDVLMPKFGSYVAHASELTKVPTWMIWGIMVTEIDPEKLEFSKSTSGARGAMQLMPITATDTIVVAKKYKNYVPDAHEAILKKNLGETRAEKIIDAVDKFDRSLVEISKKSSLNDLYNAELNIHIGALKLANLLDIYGADDLASVVVSYNKGDATAKTKYGIAGKSLKYALANTSGEPHDYILRTLGKHGGFDIVTNDLGILV
ncbi:hypothetical protein U1Q18_050182 [Sarracenia purpurea var. burkii]